MTSVTGEGAPPGGRTEDAREHAAQRPDGACRWCGGPAAWTWSVRRGSGSDAGSRGDAVWPVCAACQVLTLAGDDAGLLDRHMAALTARVGYPVAVDFLREQGAACLARWIVRRESFRALDHGALR